jgi:hypothetical protein
MSKSVSAVLGLTGLGGKKEESTNTDDKSNKVSGSAKNKQNPNKTGKSVTNKEDTSGLSDPDPKVRTAAATVPLGIWKMSGAFALTYGNGGLFPLLMRGAKKAAGGGGISKMVEFFKKFWEVQTTGNTGSGTGSAQQTDYGGYNGKGVQALHAKTYTGDENGGDPGYITGYKDTSKDDGTNPDNKDGSSSSNSSSSGNKTSSKVTKTDGGGNDVQVEPADLSKSTTKDSSTIYNKSSRGTATTAKALDFLDTFYGIGLTAKQASEFITSKKDSDIYKNIQGKKVGTDEFNQEWKNIASSNSDQFKQDQIDFALNKYYNPLKDSLKDKIDFSKVGTGVESSLFSMALSGSNSSIANGLSKDSSDEDILETIYKNKETEINNNSGYSATKKQAMLESWY